MYDVQFSFVTIYKVGKCMMPSVSKICSDLKSCEVYSSLNVTVQTIQKYMRFHISQPNKIIKIYQIKLTQRKL